jgi:hypothetical protein
MSVDLKAAEQAAEKIKAAGWNLTSPGQVKLLARAVLELLEERAEVRRRLVEMIRGASMDAKLGTAIDYYGVVRLLKLIANCIPGLEAKAEAKEGE